MPFYRAAIGGGGGSGMPVTLASPDIASRQTIYKGVSKTIAVTQTPKLVIMFATCPNTTVGYCTVHYVPTGDNNRFGYGSITGSSISNSALSVESASATEVVVKNNSSSYNLYVAVLIYY